MAWPTTLSHVMDVKSQTLIEDTTLRTKSEAGYPKSRARTTRFPKKFVINGPFMTNADRLILEAFQESVKVGADAFTWIHPIDGTTKTVTLLKEIQFDKAVGSSWDTTAELGEV